MSELSRTYSTRSWQIYESLQDVMDQDLTYNSDHDLVICHSESDLAARVGSHVKRFYVDLELRAAGVDATLSGHVARLTQDWKGHRRGSLIMCITRPPSLKESSRSQALALPKPIIAVESSAISPTQS